MGAMRAVALGLPLLLTLPLAAALSAALAERMAQQLGRELAKSSAWLVPPPAAPPDVFVEPSAGPAASAMTTKDGLSTPPQTALARPRPKGAPSAPTKGIRVRADRVLALANAGVRPAAIPVQARAERPAGLAMTGVSGLGIGLVDGDILTHAGGRPATSAGEVVGLVIGARARGAAEISGRFWRRGEWYSLVVEQPYVRPAGARSGAI